MLFDEGRANKKKNHDTYSQTRRDRNKRVTAVVSYKLHFTTYKRVALSNTIMTAGSVVRLNSELCNNVL